MVRGENGGSARMEELQVKLLQEGDMIELLVEEALIRTVRNLGHEHVHPVVAVLPFQIHSVRVSVFCVNALQKPSHC
jgi:hypothetical protein